MTAINQQVINFFERRGIDGETVARTGIWSGRRQANGDEAEVVPDPRGNIIVFPYIHGGQLWSEKYRAPEKRFWQRAGGRKTFFNADILDDPALERGDSPLVIVEGEMDALSLIASGFPFVVSVPDGAPPARDHNGNVIEVPEDDADIDPANDEKYRYVFNNWKRLERVKRIIIMTDADEPGGRLAAELVRRLGRVRCSSVVYPEGCKDANEVLLAHGSSELMRMISSARRYPVAGVYTYSELPKEPDLVPIVTGWGMLDRHLKLYTPALMVVTGFSGHGKSTWTQQLVAQVAKIHGWTTAIASFEMRIKPFVTDHLASVYLDKHRRHWSISDYKRADEWLERYFCFIAPEPECDRTHDVDWLLEKAAAAIIQHGARIILIDPWNEIDHTPHARETTTEYTNRELRKIKNFGRQYDVLMIIVAHPTKGAVNKESDELNLYDVSDSAAFQNKADIGVVVARLGDITADTLTGIHVKKIRYQPVIGTLGSIELKFDKEDGVFSQ